MTAKERRREILDILAGKRKTTASELAEMFHVSRMTIMSDIDLLSLSYPITTVKGNGGGIRVMEGEEIHHCSLKSDEEAFLRSLYPRLQPGEKVKMDQILKKLTRTIDY